ncbi:outer membrane beta-barrel protein [Helicobacter kayseriensis]|uniref:outer membrane beta-barrel protein n=1 Tax=Helicobacter kayseriensis TaxID=2905877 RepID=UPI001E3A262E|nr:outer membrane beta-barrel protein [Helicobacter kayseriensis]MCE3047393.1 outer membrane beta-barrel protein [Helicobacter kayseriensis]MCE3048936.1 outer membrane beta-barrel protein [Helicobacter kayseriensis]
MKYHRIIALVLFSILIANGMENKSGILIGIEGNLESSRFDRPLINDRGRWVDLYNRLDASGETSVSFNGGVKLGYQHYFTQSLGLRASGYFGLGSLKENVEYLDAPQKFISSYENNYLLIKTGLDLEFLWDFWERGDHALGLNLGVGYRYTHFGFESGQFRLIGFGDLRIDNIDKITAKELPTEHSIYPSIGLHYYYQAHQFALNYRFGGVLHFDSKWKYIENGSRKEYLFKQNISSTPSYFSFSYAYRF